MAHAETLVSERALKYYWGRRVINLIELEIISKFDHMCERWFGEPNGQIEIDFYFLYKLRYLLDDMDISTDRPVTIGANEQLLNKIFWDRKGGLFKSYIHDADIGAKPREFYPIPLGFIPFNQVRVTINFGEFGSIAFFNLNLKESE